MPTGDRVTPARTITDDELLQLPKDGNKYEVVDGELVATPVDLRHELVTPHLMAAVGRFAEQHGLGDVVASNALYVFPNGNKRGPDLSFVARGRLNAPGISQVFPELAPDLAIEVLSQFDTARAVLDRVGDYLDAGVRLVWVIDPVRRRGAAYRTMTSVREISSSDELDGEDVLPGFRCRLSEILD